MGIFNSKRKNNKNMIKKDTLKRLSRVSTALIRNDYDQITSEEENSEFTKLIGDEYVSKRQLNLTNEELQKMSITDGAEMWRLFSWFKKQVAPDETNEQVELSHEKIKKVAEALIKKIFVVDEVYCLYNKRTGEPHLFSRTVKQVEGYLCTPPDIRIFTKAYVQLAMKTYPESFFELKKIENGEDKKGIERFLGNCFYLNGAQGIEIHDGQVAIDAGMIIPPPNFEGTPEISIPIMNPDLMRWMLLMAQIGEGITDNEKLIYKLYYRFMAKEIVQAKFLVPMKKGKGFPDPDETGKITINKGTTLGFAEMKGKYDRSAIIMYTDWKRLNECYKGWSGTIMTLESMINIKDIAINPTDHPELGFYIGKEMYEEMKKTVNS